MEKKENKNMLNFEDSFFPHFAFIAPFLGQFLIQVTEELINNMRCPMDQFNSRMQQVNIDSFTFQIIHHFY